MGSEPGLKDFVRTGVLNKRSRSGRPTGINREKVDEVNDILQTHLGSSVRLVAEVSSIPQTTAYRIRTEHLLLKPYKVGDTSLRHLLLLSFLANKER